ncbi:hypothetical protein I552_3553 [Mycobacterium xenopi 3993]|nr:hypothetical protein I552_3553 [Mycobacterium xenopi 3993]
MRNAVRDMDAPDRLGPRRRSCASQVSASDKRLLNFATNSFAQPNSNSDPASGRPRRCGRSKSKLARRDR